MSFWIPLDPVPRETTLELPGRIAPGSVASTSKSFSRPGGALRFRGRLADLPDIEADSRQAGRSAGVEFGDLGVAFHMLTLHAAPGAGPRRRRVFSARFIGDDVRHAPRPWATSPEFPGLADSLPAGAPMDHPLFPVVWRAPRQ